MAAIIALKFRVRGQDVIHGDVPLPLGFPRLRTASKFLEKSVDFGRACHLAARQTGFATTASFVLAASNHVVRRADRIRQASLPGAGVGPRWHHPSYNATDYEGARRA